MHITSRSIVSIAAILLTSYAAWAGDPWKEKAYKEWDSNDLARIMYDSPWAKRYVNSPTAGMASVQPGPPSQSSEVGAGGYAASDLGAPSIYTPPGNLMNQPGYTVRWFSAMTMRRAIARDAVRRHALTEKQAEQGLAAPVGNHVILVLGRDMKDFQGLNEAALMQITYLRPKKTRDKIIPLQAAIHWKPDGKTIDLLMFYFAKKAANGDNLIAADEKDIEFVCEPRAITIRVTFEPPKMVTQEGSDW